MPRFMPGGPPPALRIAAFAVAGLAVASAVILVALVLGQRPGRPTSEVTVAADRGLLAWDGEHLWVWRGSEVCTPGGRGSTLTADDGSGTTLRRSLPLQTVTAFAARQERLIAVGR